MAKVKGYELVEKKNVLNQIRKNNMTLQELRLFSIYLSKINARDVSTKTVRFTLENFCKIMNIKADIGQIKENMHHLLQQIVDIPYEDGRKGFQSIQLFKKCGVFKDNESGQYFLEITAHDEALPYMFDFKERYFTYELWNILPLKSANQLRMYEILKQYEYIGKCQLSVEKIRELLNIGAKEYPRWDNFKVRVLDSCQQALTQHTDITFTYEPVRTGHKFTAVIFFIEKNEKYIDHLSLDEYIHGKKAIDMIPESKKPEIWVPLSPDTDDDTVDKIYGDENLSFLADACDYEFSPSEIRVLFDYLLEIGYTGSENTRRRYELLRQAYNRLNAASNIPKRNSISETNVHNRRFGFMKHIFEDKYEFEI